MIPPTLDAFRALMRRTVELLNDSQLDCGAGFSCSCSEDKVESVAALLALATATPAQLLGIVGTVAPAAVYSDSQEGVRCFIVTPREDA